MSSSYYESLRESGDEARRVGWRHAAEQAYRFEVALDIVRASDGRVVDVGAGLGAFRPYLDHRQPGRTWIGIEREPALLADCPEPDVIAADYLTLDAADLPSDAGCLVAIGALSGTEPRAGLEAIVSIAVTRRLPFVITVLERDRLQQRHPGYASESALGALSDDALRRAARLPEPWATRLEGISSTDSALFGWYEGAPHFRTNRQRFAAALDGPRGPFDDERAAWLAAEIGLYDTAIELLKGLEHPGPLAEITQARIDAAGSRDPRATPSPEIS